MNIVRLPSDELFPAFASWLADLVAHSGRPAFHLALPGGSTPAALFSFLSGSGGDDLPWDRFHFWWTDERVVPPADSRSNFAMADRLLLGPRAIPSSRIHRIQGELPASEAARSYGAELARSLPSADSLPAFDLVLLGIGEDGHIASLFPGAEPGAVHPLAVTGFYDGLERVSLSFEAIISAASVAFLVTGGKKASIVSRIFQPRNPADASLPSSILFSRRPDLVWFTDIAIAQSPEDEA